MFDWKYVSNCRLIEIKSLRALHLTSSYRLRRDRILPNRELIPGYSYTVFCLSQEVLGVRYSKYRKHEAQAMPVIRVIIRYHTNEAKEWRWSYYKESRLQPVHRGMVLSCSVSYKRVSRKSYKTSAAAIHRIGLLNLVHTITDNHIYILSQNHRNLVILFHS